MTRKIVLPEERAEISVDLVSLYKGYLLWLANEKS